MTQKPSNSLWSFTVSAKAGAKPSGGSESRRVARQFGLRPRASQVLYDRFRLDISPGQVVAVVGPSGAGKSVLLAHIARQAPDSRDLGIAGLSTSELTAIEAMGKGSLAGRLEVLSRCGLAEAMAMVTPARRLSGGQLYRLALAKAIWSARCAGKPMILLADEFASVLDETTAQVLCCQVRKLVKGSLVAVVAAMSRWDLLEFLQPDQVIVKELGEPPCRMACPPARKNAAPSRWPIRAGTIMDYRVLAPFHYVAGPPAAHKRVYVISPHARGGRSRGRDAPGPGVAAVAVVSPPVFGVRGRNIATAGRYVNPDGRPAVSRLNAEVECISRVIVHPLYRGCGLAVRLVRHILRRSPMPVVESLAVMGRLHPFFELAGMASWRQAKEGYVYYHHLDASRLLRNKPDKPQRRRKRQPAQDAPAKTQDRPSQRSKTPMNDNHPDWIDHPPANREELTDLVRRKFSISLASKGLCPHHNCPLDYLAASFFDQRDLLVWANRGGGKTMLAAVATVLDAVFRRPSTIRVLGGSFDQSDRLAEYIRDLLAGHEELLDGAFTRRRVRLIGGSEIRVLAQSQRAVRGQHVQKIRCDEVDLFDAEVWRAVQFSTRSAGSARGSIEVLSTLHRPGGLMQDLVSAARAASPGDGGYRLIQWCLWEVIERCEEGRRCEDCLLADDCGGVARRGSGFFRIDDAIAIKARSSRASWETEMLCRGPSRHGRIFEEFDPGRHISPVAECADWPTYRAIDFGYRNPLVCLWIQVTPAGAVHVLDEYVRSRLPLTRHAQEILRRSTTPVAATYVDPAGRAREATSGAACTEMLAAAGIPCTTRASRVAEGLELIRAALDPAAGSPSLLVHPRCKRMIEAFLNYHYEQEAADRPAKDGPDHLIDALRYFFINRMRPRIAIARGRY